MTPSPEPAIARRHAAIRRAVTPLPGSRPRDHFKPLNIPGGCDGLTLLAALGRMVENVSAVEWQAEFARGRIVSLEQKPVATTQIVRAGQRYRHLFPDVTEPAVNGAVEILHEDEALIVVNKPAPAADARRRPVPSQHAPAHLERGLPSADAASGAPAGRQHHRPGAGGAHAGFRRSSRRAGWKKPIWSACRDRRPPMNFFATRPSAPAPANGVRAPWIWKTAWRRTRNSECSGTTPTARACSKRGR